VVAVISVGETTVTLVAEMVPANRPLPWPMTTVPRQAGPALGETAEMVGVDRADGLASNDPMSRVGEPDGWGRTWPCWSVAGHCATGI